MGWPSNSNENGAVASMPALDRQRTPSKVSASSRWASSNTTSTALPRSAASAANRSWVWGMSEAAWKRATPPRAATIPAYMPRSPTPGVPRYTTVCREASSPATAARAATVLPDPHSPVTTPMARSAMHHWMRATASAWLRWACSTPGASVLANGMREKP